MLMLLYATHKSEKYADGLPMSRVPLKDTLCGAVKQVKENSGDTGSDTLQRWAWVDVEWDTLYAIAGAGGL